MTCHVRQMNKLFFCLASTTLCFLYKSVKVNLKSSMYNNNPKCLSHYVPNMMISKSVYPYNLSIFYSVIIMQINYVWFSTYTTLCAIYL